MPDKEREERLVLCGASAYSRKFYLHEKFHRLPDSIKEELQVICVLFTGEVGGTISLVFEKDGALVIETGAAETDYYYDEIGSGLLVKEIRRTRQELLESLSLFYRTVILGETL